MSTALPFALLVFAFRFAAAALGAFSVLMAFASDFVLTFALVFVSAFVLALAFALDVASSCWSSISPLAWVLLCQRSSPFAGVWAARLVRRRRNQGVLREQVARINS